MFFFLLSSNLVFLVVGCPGSILWIGSILKFNNTLLPRSPSQRQQTEFVFVIFFPVTKKVANGRG